VKAPLVIAQQFVHVHGLLDDGLRFKLQTRSLDNPYVQEANDRPPSLVHGTTEDDHERK